MNVKYTSDITTSPRAGRTTPQDVLPTKLWQRIALGIILLLAAFMNLFRLEQNGYGNTYYAAAVKSMLMSWHNFFFVSFDPGGFVSIDKPPLGFWIQAACAALFGFHGWSLLLPQAIAGIGSVALLYVLVRRAFGSMAGLLAALALALTPISIVTSRDNTIDSLLVLTVLLATWAISLASETGRLRWLLLSALLIGLGFNIKMLEAYLVVPAFVLMYLLGAPLSWRTRLLHLVLAGVVLPVVSFSWISAVDLTPASQRPYVGSSQSNSELELALGYNGLGRITGVIFGGSTTTARTGAQKTQPALNLNTLTLLLGISETGLPGPFRLVNPQLGGQIGWLLLFAGLSLIAVARWKRPSLIHNRRQQGLLLWGVWFVTLFVFFSLALIAHAYYLVTFAPAVCALVGIGGVVMYRDYRARSGWCSWLFPVALVGTALVQAHILSTFPDWSRWLTPLIVGLCLLAAVFLVGARLVKLPVSLTPLGPVATLGMLSLLIAPTIWGAIPVWAGSDSAHLVAGPPRRNDAFAALARSFIAEEPHAQPELVHYLLVNQGKTRFLAATINALAAAPLIIDTDKPVMALGGFIGTDQIVTSEQFATMVRNREVRFFLLPSFAGLRLSDLPPQFLKYLILLLNCGRCKSGGNLLRYRPKKSSSRLCKGESLCRCTLKPFIPSQRKQPV